jgi:hypothetical protein
VFEHLKEMQQLRFHGRIVTHRQGQCPLWSGQTPCALDQLTPQRAELLELPQRRPTFGGIALLCADHHLHLPVEVVGQHGGENKYQLHGVK